MNAKKIFLENKKRLLSYDEKFYKIFRVHITKFADSLMLFDVVKFDKSFIKSSDKGMCCKDAVREEYGLDAMILILKILGVSPVKKKKIDKRRKIRKEKV